jgi:hypothetical protein
MPEVPACLQRDAFALPVLQGVYLLVCCWPEITMSSASSDASGFTFNPGMDALHTPFRKT